MSTAPSALRPLAEGLWCFEHDLYLPGGVHFPGRSCVVRLDDGSLWIHSPNPIDDALADQLAALGPVGHLVAPNKLHHLHLAAAIERYPNARVWGAPGLSAKRDDLHFDAELDDAAPSEWSGQIDQVVTRGAPWVNEVVFVHRRSRTLLLTDLVFNVQAPRGVMTRLVFWMAGASGKLAQSRLLKSQVKDRPAFAKSGDAVMGLDFDKVVMAHGQPLLDDDARGRPPREQLGSALEWMLAGSAA